MSGRIARAATMGHRVALDIFNGIKSALHIPIIAGVAAGATTYLWLAVLIPGLTR
jgi:hypothetical protein